MKVLDRLTIGRKLVVLLVTAQALLVLVGLNGLRSQTAIKESSDEIASSVDAVRASVLADMHHDALRADALESLEATVERRNELAVQAREAGALLLAALDDTASAGTTPRSTRRWPMSGPRPRATSR